ncbi:MAG: glycoside hydrolase family 31 protein [candidate division KSB1 bacterium]|nr:glycoside hydrolase family 31 protein [candidate division KSB1 bacterium]MDZ7369436.1 glycoside hydrolase family 31 protein [candidate division KSB1 bacterium]
MPFEIFGIQIQLAGDARENPAQAQSGIVDVDHGVMVFIQGFRKRTQRRRLSRAHFAGDQRHAATRDEVLEALKKRLA